MDNKSPYNNNIESSNRRLGGIFLIVSWIIVILLVTALINFSLFGTKKPIINATQAGTQITIFRDNDSHFRLKGSINNVPVTFLLDTGATSIAVSSELADKAGLKHKAELTTETANGTTVGYFTIIDKASIGDVELSHVSAVIVPNMASDQALLGMNVLKHFEIKQTADTMVLTVPRSITQ